jgi:hypothetical protein
MNNKKIAIIGAGWMGISCLRILRECGHSIDVFEKRSDIGGVWHPDNSYAGLSLDAPSFTIEYFDHPLPDHIDRSERIPSFMVYEYLKSYCREKDLYKHINFNVSVHKVDYVSSLKKIRIYFKESSGDSEKSAEYDYVIYTNGVSNRDLPRIKNAQKFTGKMIHSFEANEDVVKSIVVQNKAVTILGASKTAIDLVLYFQRLGYKVTWLYRSSYWFFRYDPLRRCLKFRLKGKSSLANLIEKCLYGLGLILKGNPILFWIWRLCNDIHNPGEKHHNFNKFHLAYVDDAQMKILKEYNNQCGIVGEIADFDGNTIILSDGRKFQSDLIICCTGSGLGSHNINNMLNVCIDNNGVQLDQVRDVYRSRVIPEIPKLIFTTYVMASTGVSNGLITAEWIKKYIECDFGTEHLKKHSAHYAFSFFLRHALCNSEENLAAYSARAMDEFFKAGEIRPLKYFKWYLGFFFGGKGTKPLSFNNPAQFK